MGWNCAGIEANRIKKEKQIDRAKKLKFPLLVKGYQKELKRILNGKAVYTAL